MFSVCAGLYGNVPCLCTAQVHELEAHLVILELVDQRRHVLWKPGPLQVAIEIADGSLKETTVVNRLR